MSTVGWGFLCAHHWWNTKCDHNLLVSTQLKQNTQKQHIVKIENPELYNYEECLCFLSKERKAHVQLVCAATVRDLLSVRELTDEYKRSGGHICTLHAELWLMVGVLIFLWLHFPTPPLPPQPMSEQETTQCENRRKSFKVRKTSPILLSNVNKNWNVCWNDADWQMTQLALASKYTVNRNMNHSSSCDIHQWAD